MIKIPLAILIASMAGMAAAQRIAQPSYELPTYQTYLLRYPSVQKDLALNPSVLKRLAAVQARARKEAMASLQTQSSGVVKQPSLAEVKRRIRKVDDAMVAFLSAAQRTRLKQIGLQVTGAFALLDPQVGKAVEISAGQKARIHASGMQALQTYQRSIAGLSSPRGSGFRNRAANAQGTLQKMAGERLKMLNSFRAEARRVLMPNQRTIWQRLEGRPFPVATVLVPPKLSR